VSRRAFSLFAVLLTSTSLLAQPAPPKTTAESSNYKATTRHADVVAFGETLAKHSPLINLQTLGTSSEGRALPLWIIAEPPVKNAADARRSDKLTVLLMGNIHAGEVDGKEALMMFARNLVGSSDRELLKDLIVLIVPILNSDGNERLAKGHRPQQAGPEEVGDRENAGGLDLNRDFVKLESPEIRALVKCLRIWDPAIFVDLHTTNGSRHRHTLTYDGPRHPNTGDDRIAFGKSFTAAAANRLHEATGYDPLPYGNFSRDRTLWETYPAQPRYGVQYAALRGRMSVLSESYSYAPFQDRVRASLEFVRGICKQAIADKDKLKSLKEEPSPRIALRNKTVAEPNQLSVHGYEETQQDGKRVTTDKPKNYAVTYVAKVQPTLEVTRPIAYLFPGNLTKVIEVLQRHGVQVQELREDIELDVDVYRVTQVEQSQREYQGHRMVNRVEVQPRTEPRMIPAGTTIVRTDQPLGTLAALMLEPQSEDGLATWNFFDAGLKDGADFPVMRLTKETALTTGSVRPLSEDRVLNRPIDLNLTLGQGRPPSLNGNPIGGLAWLDDGEHFLQTKQGRLFKVHARTGRMEPFVDPKLMQKSLAAIEGLDNNIVKSLSASQNLTLVINRTSAQFSHKGENYIAFVDGRPAKKLPKPAGPQEYLTYSPDGNYVAFVRDGNLWIGDINAGTERQLTTDGGGAILNGKADWVYEEEIFDRRAKTFWWSPDSKHIAFLRFDDTPVKQFTVVNHIPTRLNVEQYPYPKAGDPNPLVKLGVASINNGQPRFVDIPDTNPDDLIISRVDWWPDSSLIYCYVQNRVQDYLDLFVAPLTGETPRKLFRETTQAWVDNTGPLHFLPDGSFLFASDRTGFRHLYHYRPNGELIRPVTSGNWETRQVLGTDPEGNWAYFNATRDSVRGTNAYRARINNGDAPQRLTPADGAHNATVSAKSGLAIDTFSSLNETPKVILRDASGAVVRTLDSNPVYQREEYRFGKVEAVQVPMPDGFRLEGLLIYPPNFDVTKKYPVWIKTYAGPHAPTVSDSWAGGRVNDQAMASAGIVSFLVDPRSASGVGAKYTWTAYKQLGVQELKDLEAAVDWLTAKPWVDPKRIGLSGHSYGGFMTAYALTHSKKFAAGISGAPVTDWRLYDSIYTERYMHLPKENPKGYDATSCVKAARNLHGKLLLLHGLMDDNVHVQNSVQFINQLQLADKDFEVMVYPTARHGIGGRHYQRQIVNFICRSMGVDVQLPPRGPNESDESTNNTPPRRRRDR